MSPNTKKHVSLAVRLVLAAAGIGFILYNIDWVDRVEVRPGAVLPDGTKVTTVVFMRVVEGDMDPRGQREPLTLSDPRTTPAQRVVLSPERLIDSDQFLLRPSFVTTVTHARIGLLLLGFAIVGPVFPVQAYRWLILMRCRGLDVSYGKALRLTMVGSFFNYCMPGSTGGDVVKAYYAARRSDRRTDSIMSVVYDRIAGLLGLVALATIVGLFMLDEPLARTITINIALGWVFLVAGSVVYFSSRLRKALGVEWIVGKLPGRDLFGKIDRAAVAYRDHKGAVLAAVLMSIPVHLALSGATAVAGYALGMDTRIGLLLTVVPVIFLSGSVPITPQGAGVWELLGKAMLFNPPAVTMNQIVAMLLMARIYQLAFSLTGSVFLFKGDIHMHPEREEKEPQTQGSGVELEEADRATPERHGER